jgi:hypothetical protein
MLDGLFIILLYVLGAAAKMSLGAKHNTIAQENSLPGDKSWWYQQPGGNPTIVGFTDRFSYYEQDKVFFKVHDTKSGPWFHLKIYRLGYYGGNGARLLSTLQVMSAKQPACMFEKVSRLTDCSNWNVSAEWSIPAGSVSGVYIALPVRREAKNKIVYGGYIPFVVRQHPFKTGSSILFKTADLTWVAYNLYGGYNVYRQLGVWKAASRAGKASYNRPFQNRAPFPRGLYYNSITGVEFPMIYWLEKHGYDVSYCSCADIEDLDQQNLLVPPTHQHGTTQSGYQLILSVGHDEYWTPGMKAAHEHARENGIHLAFFSGNEVFWRSVWDENMHIAVSGSSNPGAASLQRQGNAYILPVGSKTPVQLDNRRVMVCRKETLTNEQLALHPDDWTGTFRDPRHRVPDDESLLTGQNFLVNGEQKDYFSITAEDAQMRFWRDASFAASSKRVARITPTAIVHKTPVGILGYEWDAFPIDSRPDGLIPLSTTHRFVVEKVLRDYGSYLDVNDTMTHRLSLYRHIRGADVAANASHIDLEGFCRLQDMSSSAGSPHMEDRATSLVFGAGTVQWSWALSSWHDGAAVSEDRDLQQATLNLFADMDVFPTTLRKTVAGSSHPLVYPSVNKDKLPPASTITDVRIKAVGGAYEIFVAGTALDAGGGNVAAVEVSVDGGQSWRMAEGRAKWTFVHRIVSRPAPAPFEMQKRVSPEDVVRSRLFQQNVLFDGHCRNSTGAGDGSAARESGHASARVLVLARAVDDSAWMERTQAGPGLCALARPSSHMSSTRVNPGRRSPAEVVPVLHSIAPNAWIVKLPDAGIETCL